MRDDRPPASAPAPPPRADPSLLGQARIDELCLFNLLSASIDTLYFKDLQSRFIRVSDSQARLTGAPSAEAMQGKTDFDYFTPEHARAAYAVEQEIIRTGEPQADIHQYDALPEGRRLVISSTKQALRDFDGSIVGTFGISRDITAGRYLEAELAAKTRELDRLGRELKTILDISPDPIARFGTDLRYTYVNRATEVLTGFSSDQLIGRGFSARGLPEDDVRERERHLGHVIATGEPLTIDSSSMVAGTQRFLQVYLVPELDGRGRVRSVLAVSHDVTDRKRVEDMLAAEAAHDPLTRLANRKLLTHRIGQAVEKLATGAGPLALLFIDLDRFKAVNDVHGHSVGDDLLIAAAVRIRNAARGDDLVARFGGDEFAVVCEGIGSRAAAVAVAERVITSLRQPFDAIRPGLDVSASVGIAMACHPAKDPEAFLQEADAAMYRAKALGNVDGAYAFFEDDQSG